MSASAICGSVARSAAARAAVASSRACGEGGVFAELAHRRPEVRALQLDCRVVLQQLVLPGDEGRDDRVELLLRRLVALEIVHQLAAARDAPEDTLRARQVGVPRVEVGDRRRAGPAGRCATWACGSDGVPRPRAEASDDDGRSSIRFETSADERISCSPIRAMSSTLAGELRAARLFGRQSRRRTRLPSPRVRRASRAATRPSRPPGRAAPRARRRGRERRSRSMPAREASRLVQVELGHRHLLRRALRT